MCDDEKANDLQLRALQAGSSHDQEGTSALRLWSSETPSRTLRRKNTVTQVPENGASGQKMILLTFKEAAEQLDLSE